MHYFACKCVIMSRKNISVEFNIHQRLVDYCVPNKIGIAGYAENAILEKIARDTKRKEVSALDLSADVKEWLVNGGNIKIGIMSNGEFGVVKILAEALNFG